MTILQNLQDATLTMAKRPGGFEVFASSDWRRRRLMILCYHGVSQLDEHEWSNLYVSTEHLRHRFDLLRSEGYCILTLDEGIRRLYDRTLPPRAVSITFDDGAVDFYRQAYPVLKEFGFHATLYLTTFYCFFSVRYSIRSFPTSFGRGVGDDST